jgi:hypothetical protein
MQKRLEQLKQIVGHFNDEKTVKMLIENGNNNNKNDEDDDDEEIEDIAVEDLSDVEDFNEEKIFNKDILMEKYKNQAQLNISQLSSLLNT